MDSPEERDQAVDRLLRQSLQTPAPGGVTDACLDAETLAAWADGALSGGALDAVHAHVADCARCQDLAGTLARIRSAVPPAEPVRSQRWWLAWLVPVAAAAAALAIWFAVPANLGAPAKNRDVALVREVPPERIETPGRLQPAPDVPIGPLANRRELQSAPQAAGSLEERASAPSPAAEQKAQQESARSDLAKDQAIAQTPPAAAASTPSALRAAAAPAPAERFRAAESVRGNDIGPDILSPDSAIRWRIVGAAVQHSSNGGSTWEVVPLDAAAELTGGAAPATNVCWLVGRGGVVLLTVDGRTWRRVPFPEMTDLSGVRAIDAGGRVASVSTADGRTFVTTDAGVTWMPR